MLQVPTEANCVFFGFLLKLTFNILSVFASCSSLHISCFMLFRACKELFLHLGCFQMCHSNKTHLTWHCCVALLQCDRRISPSFSAATPGWSFAVGLYIFWNTENPGGRVLMFSCSHVVRFQPCLTSLSGSVVPLSNTHV